MYRFDVLDDPFQTKDHLKRLAAEFQQTTRREAIDLSRGDPADAPSALPEQAFAQLLIESSGSSTPQERAPDVAALLAFVSHLVGERNFPDADEKDGLRGRGYSPDVHGDSAPRRVVAEYLNRYLSRTADGPATKASPEHITLFAGASEAVSVVFKLLAKQGMFGDSAALAGIGPVYGPYNAQFQQWQHLESRTFMLNTTRESEYRLPTERILAWKDRVLRARPVPDFVVFVAVSPNNPTGAIYTPDELKTLAHAINEIPNCLVVEDLVYAEFSDQQPFTPFYQLLPQRTLAIGSLSKAYRATGMRFGYTFVSPQLHDWCLRTLGLDLLEELKLVKSPDRIGAFSHTHHLARPVQYLGMLKLAETLQDDRELLSFVEALRTRWGTFQTLLDLDILPGFAPYYCLVNLEELLSRSTNDSLRAALETPEQVFEALARDCGVVLLPAATFFVGDEAAHRWHARVSVANVDLKTVSSAGQRIREFFSPSPAA